MHSTGFLCPECHVPLRLRDRSQLGREIDCPDCGTRLRIVADAGHVQALRATGVSDFKQPPRPGSKGTLRLIWLATACVGGAVVWLAARPAPVGSEVKRPAVVDADETPAPNDEPAIEPPPASVDKAIVKTPEAAERSEQLPLPALPIPEPPAIVPEPAAVTEADRPIDPVLAPDVPTVDLAVQLSLRIAEFSQRKPVPVRLLLRQVAELSAVPVDLSRVEVDPWREKLDQAITLELTATTVGGVLEAILNQAGLRWEEHDQAITIAPPTK